MKSEEANIFEVQPEWCREALPPKVIEHSDWAHEQGYAPKWDRVLAFDPTKIYERIGDRLNPYQRIHNTSVILMFPSIEGLCACGCNQELGKGRRRWANDMCGSFAFAIRSIICNTHQIPGFYIAKYYGSQDCIKCGDPNWDGLDHIIPVKLGGGGSWLSNYQYLCRTCHVDKTNSDFGHGQYKQTNQMKMEL